MLRKPFPEKLGPQKAASYTSIVKWRQLLASTDSTSQVSNFESVQDRRAKHVGELHFGVSVLRKELTPRAKYSLFCALSSGDREICEMPPVNVTKISRGPRASTWTELPSRRVRLHRNSRTYMTVLCEETAAIVLISSQQPGRVPYFDAY